MHYTGKYCDVSPYTDAYDSIKSVSIVEAATAYYNPDTVETKILIIYEEIFMCGQM